MIIEIDFIIRMISYLYTIRCVSILYVMHILLHVPDVNYHNYVIIQLFNNFLNHYIKIDISTILW